VRPVRIFSPAFAASLRLASAAAILSIALDAHWLPAQAPLAASAGLDTVDREASVPVVPQQVHFTGNLFNRAGDTVEAVFRIYAAEQGGEPLWTETQHVSVGPDGKYAVDLGSATEHGLPESLFAAGQARWLGVSVERAPEEPRTLLASVPYAMKAADAATLAGRRAADFVTQAQLDAVSRELAAQALAAAPLLDPALTGSGTANTVAMFTGPTSLGNAPITVSGINVGIDNTNPVYPLDVKGMSTLRGGIKLETTSLANPTVGVTSPPLEFQTSTYSSALGAAVPQYFTWQVTPTGNNTASPAAKMNLLAGSGVAGATPTGLSIGPTGLLTFASGQAFPGTGPGTITKISADSPLTGGGSGPIVSLSLDNTAEVAQLQPVFNSTYAQLGAANTFTTGQSIQGASSISGNTPAGAQAILSVTNAGQGPGIAGYTTQGNYSMGIFGSMSPSATSGSFDLLFYTDGFGAGIWADGINHGIDNYSALIATADDMFAGNFFNDSASLPTISVLNNHAGGTTGNSAGIATVLRAGGPDGVCGINQAGAMACTGGMKTLVNTRTGDRQVETYAVQSAENWLEDYGSGELHNGAATIALDPAFAETVNTGVEFHVFLTPGGDCKGLYVSHKTATSFEVHEFGGGTASISFDYKIVAKRTGHETERLVDVTERMRAETEAARPKPVDKRLHATAPSPGVRKAGL
jgi:hypothetical protein